MKQQLEHFNQLIFELQYAETKRYSDYSSMELIRMPFTQIFLHSLK